MEANQLSFVLLGLFLVIGAHTGYALKCYICNSGTKYDGETCSDVVQLKKATSLYKDCSEQEVQDGARNGSYIYCRAMTQNVEGDYRVIRQCASEGRLDRCIERTGTKDIKLSYCHCDKDGCNTASGLYSPVTMVLSVAMAAVAYFVRS